MYDLKIKRGETVELFYGIDFEILIEKIIKDSRQNVSHYVMIPTVSEIRKLKNIIDRGYKKAFTTINGSEITIIKSSKK